MQDKPKFIMLVGVAGSGKSTVAEDWMKGRDDIVYVSSDAIREEKFGDAGVQDRPSEIFDLMLIRTKEALLDGKTVIYDATNLNSKRRKGLLQQLPRKADFDKIVVYVATPIEQILKQNSERDRVVPDDVIDRMYKTLQVPVYSEGWDKIVFEYDEETAHYDSPKQFTDAVRAGVLFGREGKDLMVFLAQYYDEFFAVYDLPHDSKWHSLSVHRHIYEVYKQVLDNYEGEDKEMMLWTALLHDIGKKYCKTFISRKGEEMTHAQFIGHEYVGSQIAIPFLKRMNFEDEFIHNVATLVQYHMFLLDANANKKKLLDKVGEDFYAKLEFLRDADTKAH